MNEILSNSPGSDTPFALIDGVAPVNLNISKETENLRKIVGDEKNSQLERLAAYEDIMNIEVGDTSLTRARNIEREASLIAFLQEHNRESMEGDRYVSILTGRK